MSSEDFFAKAILMDISSVAEWMKVDTGFITQLMRNGVLPFIVLNGEEKLRLYDIVKYIDRNMTTYSEVKEDIERIMKANNRKKEEKDDETTSS